MQAVEQGWVQRGGRAGRQPGAGDQGGEWDLHREGPWAQLRLERFKKENNLSRFTLGKSFWEQHD